MSKLDIKRVRYFLKLSEMLNFSDAARALNVSQPGLTKSIAQLERDLGGVLIRREGRNTHLTPLGSRMLEYFRQLDKVARDVELATMRLIEGEMPILRLGLMCTIGPKPISDFLAKFQKQNPELEVVIKTLTRAQLSAVILAGDVDLAIVGAEISDQQKFRYTQLYTEQMVVATSCDHPFAKRTSVSLDEVIHQPYVDRLQCEFRDTFLAEAHRRSFNPMFVARSDNEEWAHALIEEGVGVSVLPEKSVLRSNITATKLDDTQLERSVMVAIPFGREDNKVVRDFLKAANCYEWN